MHPMCTGRVSRTALLGAFSCGGNPSVSIFLGVSSLSSRQGCSGFPPRWCDRPQHCNSSLMYCTLHRPSHPTFTILPCSDVHILCDPSCHRSAVAVFVFDDMSSTHCAILPVIRRYFRDVLTFSEPRDGQVSLHDHHEQPYTMCCPAVAILWLHVFSGFSHLL